MDTSEQIPHDPRIRLEQQYRAPLTEAIFVGLERAKQLVDSHVIMEGNQLILSPISRTAVVMHEWGIESKDWEERLIKTWNTLLQMEHLPPETASRMQLGTAVCEYYCRIGDIPQVKELINNLPATVYPPDQRLIVNFEDVENEEFDTAVDSYKELAAAQLTKLGKDEAAQQFVPPPEDLFRYDGAYIKALIEQASSIKKLDGVHNDIQNATELGITESDYTTYVTVRREYYKKHARLNLKAGKPYEAYADIQQLQTLKFSDAAAILSESLTNDKPGLTHIESISMQLYEDLCLHTENRVESDKPDDFIPPFGTIAVKTKTEEVEAEPQADSLSYSEAANICLTMYAALYPHQKLEKVSEKYLKQFIYFMRHGSPNKVHTLQVAYLDTLGEMGLYSHLRGEYGLFRDEVIANPDLNAETANTQIDELLHALIKGLGGQKGAERETHELSKLIHDPGIQLNALQDLAIREITAGKLTTSQWQHEQHSIRTHLQQLLSGMPESEINEAIKTYMDPFFRKAGEYFLKHHRYEDLAEIFRSEHLTFHTFSLLLEQLQKQP